MDTKIIELHMAVRALPAISTEVQHAVKAEVLRLAEALDKQNAAARAERDEAVEQWKLHDSINIELTRQYAAARNVLFDVSTQMNTITNRMVEIQKERDAARAEVDELKSALALGQVNCDAAYDDLRRERDTARAALKPQPGAEDDRALP